MGGEREGTGLQGSVRNTLTRTGEHGVVPLFRTRTRSVQHSFVVRSISV